MLVVRLIPIKRRYFIKKKGKKMKKLKLILVVVLCIGIVLSFSIAGCKTTASTEAPKELRQVKYVLPRSLEVLDDAHVWAGLKMGYFAQQGLDLSIEQSYGTTDIKMLAADQAEFAIPSPGFQMVGRDQELPLKSIFQVDTRQIFGFCVKAGSDIKTIEDLKGKTISLGDAAWDAISNQFIVAAGLKPEDVNYVVGGESRAQMVDQGQADAVLTWQKEFQLWAGQGLEFDYIDGEPYIPGCANSVVVTEKRLSEEPELIKAFGRAYAQALYFTKLNPQAATQIVLAQFPAIKLTMEQALPSIEALVYITNDKDTETKGYGWHNVDEWNLVKKYMMETGILTDDIDVTTLWTNEFVDYYNDFDKAAVEADAKNFKME